MSLGRRGHGLSFETSLLISLSASPGRLLHIEGKTDAQAVEELLHEATQYPKRTKAELARYGPGTGKVRVDVISYALGAARKAIRHDEEAAFKYDSQKLRDTERILSMLAERAGGALQDFVAEGESESSNGWRRTDW